MEILGRSRTVVEDVSSTAKLGWQIAFRRRFITYYLRREDQGHLQWLDNCCLYVSRILHADDRADNLYNGLSANYLLYA